MNRSELVNTVSEKAGLSRADAQKAVSAIFDVDNGAIAEALRSGDSVAISGFGSFKVNERAARKGRNPQTGAEIDIAASKAAAFSAGKGLKDALKA